MTLLDKIAGGSTLEDALREELEIDELHDKAFDLDTSIDVAAAIQELTIKTHEQIEHETALKWAARAIAAIRLGLPEALDYKHEALEHASQVGGYLVDLLGAKIDFEQSKSERK